MLAQLKKLKEFFSSPNREEKKWLLPILGILGILLLSLPSLLPKQTTDEEAVAAPQTAADRSAELESALCRVVCAVTGESNPTVMVTLEDGGRLLYAQDEQKSENSTENTHVIVKAENGVQTALTVTELSPEVKGVVVVSAFGADALIREMLTEAVMTALNISANRVCVLSSHG